MGDLYAEEAVIRNTRRYPSGEVRRRALTAPQYRALLQQAIPIATQRGDRSSYSDVKYTAEGPNVRITATRVSELKRYASPLTLLVGRRADGRWMIYKELSESQPSRGGIAVSGWATGRGPWCRTRGSAACPPCWPSGSRG